MFARILCVALVCLVSVGSAARHRGFDVPTLASAAKLTPSGPASVVSLPLSHCAKECGGRTMVANTILHAKNPVVVDALAIPPFSPSTTRPRAAKPHRRVGNVSNSFPANFNREEEEDDENPDGLQSGHGAMLALTALQARVDLMIHKLSGEVQRRGKRGSDAPTAAYMDLRRLKKLKREVLERLKSSKASANRKALTPEQARRKAREYRRKARKVARLAKKLGAPRAPKRLGFNKLNKINYTLPGDMRELLTLATSVGRQLHSLGRAAAMAVTGGGLTDNERRRTIRAELVRDLRALQTLSVRPEHAALRSKALLLVSRGIAASDAYSRSSNSSSTDLSQALESARTALAAVQLAGTSPAVVERARAALADLQRVALKNRTAKRIRSIVRKTVRDIRRMATRAHPDGNVADARKKVIYRVAYALKRVRRVVERQLRQQEQPNKAKTLASAVVKRLQSAQQRVEVMAKTLAGQDKQARDQIAALGKEAASMETVLKGNIDAGRYSLQKALQRQRAAKKRLDTLEDRLDSLEYKLHARLGEKDGQAPKARKGKHAGKGKNKRKRRGKRNNKRKKKKAKAPSKAESSVAKIDSAVQNVKAYFDQLLRKEVKYATTD